MCNFVLRAPRSLHSQVTRVTRNFNHSQCHFNGGNKYLFPLRKLEWVLLMTWWPHPDPRMLPPQTFSLTLSPQNLSLGRRHLPFAGCSTLCYFCPRPHQILGPKLQNLSSWSQALWVLKWWASLCTGCVLHQEAPLPIVLCLKMLTINWLVSDFQVWTSIY